MRIGIVIGLLLLLLAASATETVTAASVTIPSSSSSYIITINYYLINTNLDDRTVDFTVPIPPNTTWQTSHLVWWNFQPTRPTLGGCRPPAICYSDSASNSLMDFSLLVPSLNVRTLSYQVSVDVNSTPGYPVSPNRPATKSDIPATLQNFTVPTYWWNYTDRIFSDSGAEISLSPYRNESNLFTVANAVRNQTLSQIFSGFRTIRVRVGATEALTQHFGDSSEYSDVFVSLMRSLSLPSTRLWSWLVDDVRGGVLTWHGFVQSAFWAPGYGWLPYDVTTSLYVNRPAIGEVSDRTITFYIENNLPGPGAPIPLMLSQDETFFPGGGAALKSGVIASSQISLIHVPQTPSAAVQLFTLTTTVGVFGAAAILIIFVIAIGFLRARARRRTYRERLDQFEKRLRGVTHG